ncbi:hypothetical protein CWI37_1797p0010 [Hamiltosporidium tvaerminnensis]|uniref:Uncharacterized protein n=1 Tax=Hamiltosporidium tvaerminnensis TaxID=1176355 RepID=A0A4V2JU12_9MICR|nr:hypothetical protein CWI37_1797p0010 [Hamiltosporidium tvaerminnensis]
MTRIDKPVVAIALCSVIFAIIFYKWEAKFLLKNLNKINDQKKPGSIEAKVAELEAKVGVITEILKDHIDLKKAGEKKGNNTSKK